MSNAVRLLAATRFADARIDAAATMGGSLTRQGYVAADWCLAAGPGGRVAIADRGHGRRTQAGTA